MLNGRCGYRDVLSNILFPSSEEKLSRYDVTKRSLQHYALPPSFRGERKKERNNR
jgi:hypothetical protein